MTNQYPGNPSLPPEVRDRVLSTFRQTLALYRQGRIDEVVVGCELLLKMDAMFDPAKKLMETARNPDAAIDVDTLLPTPSVADARQAVSERNFQAALEICNVLLAADVTNEEALRIGEEAREAIEAGPFVEQFLSKVRAQVAAGDTATAKATLEKVRALDPGHPEIAALTRTLNPTPEGAFDFGGADTSHFASAFGSSQAAPAAPQPSAGFDFGGSAGAPPAPAEPAAFDFGAPAPVEDSTSFVAEAPAEDVAVEIDAAASSFVVESSSAAPAAGAAADFGFTFEEEQKSDAPPAGGFSFDAPAASQPADFSFDAAPAGQSGFGEAQTFDFAAAGVEVSSDDQGRIEKYLVEGDAAFATGDYANAIDVWSRIFLIDVTNEQASERIEKARKLRADVDRKVEELMAAGNAAFQKKDLALARKKFEEVLQIDPRNDDASAFLQRVEQASAENRPGIDMAAAMSMPKQPSADFFDDFVPPSADADADAETEISETPSGGSAKPRSAGRKAAPTKPSRNMVPYAIAAAAVLLLAIGGWFGYSKFFGAGYDSAKTAATFTSAQSLAQAGDFDQAIQLLSAISSEDPEHNKALLLIADFKNQKQKKGLIGGRPADEVLQEQVDKGRQAFDNHDFTAAKEWFEKASQIKSPLPPDVRSMLETASLQVAQLDNAKILFKEGNYAGAIANVDTLLAQNPNNKNALAILADAHFNLGVQALQDERLKEAIAEFDEVLEMHPDDELAKRSRELAVRYETQNIDLLYRIYAKHLPRRRS